MNKLFIFLLFVVISCPYSAEANLENSEKFHDDVAAKESEHIVAELLRSTTEDLVTKALGESDPLVFPYFPMIAAGTISISLTGFEIGGFLKIRPMPHNLLQPILILEVEWPNIHVTAEEYIAGGHLYHLPFAGNSNLNLTIDSLRGFISYEHVPKTGFKPNYCMVANTSDFLVTIDQLVVRFNDLNPGEDTGEVVNSMLSSVGTDVTIAVTDLLNGPLYYTLDKAATKVINTVLNTRPTLFESCVMDATEDVDDFMEDIIKTLVTEFTDGGIISMFLENFGNVGAVENIFDDILEKMNRIYD